MNVLVIGATGATGRVAVDELVARGHRVTAFARTPVAREGVRVVQGDATDPGDVDRAMAGQDGVVVALGIRENPVAVRLRGSRGTPMDVRSTGTRRVIEAMTRHGVRRLVVQTTYGAGDSRAGLSLKWRVLFDLLLRPQIADSERQEEAVRDSGLDWVLVRPVALTDAPRGPVATSTEGRVPRMDVPRRSVAGVLADAIESATLVHETVAVSAA